MFACRYMLQYPTVELVSQQHAISESESEILDPWGETGWPLYLTVELSAFRPNPVVQCFTQCFNVVTPWPVCVTCWEPHLIVLPKGEAAELLRY